MPQARPTHLRAHQAQPGKAGPAPRTSLWPTALLAPLTLAHSTAGTADTGPQCLRRRQRRAGHRDSQPGSCLR